MLSSARLFASHLKSDLLLAKNLPWPEYLRLPRDISLKAARSQQQVRELRITIMLAIEAERQRRYNDTIREKREVISSLISTGGRTCSFNVASEFKLKKVASSMALTEVAMVYDLRHLML
ncbi:hypothetical protein MSAN_00903300 [Mycena sanguinolenta]|uniref:Uncharacterized protein n=1 Tax=Mycena sanguinolenta TaxID=230812 RepID=A0A8H7DBY7_9AGAR|nr:hypothetical protein MSAN_00903300 [Mycena sanguinolenta]